LHGRAPVIPPPEAWVRRHAARTLARGAVREEPVSPVPSNQGELEELRANNAFSGDKAWFTDDFKPEINWVTMKTTEDVKTPQTFEDALNSNHSAQWWDAMKEEVDALVELKTWEEVPRGHILAKSIVTGKWVYAVKQMTNDEVRFKARWVARGFTQQEGIDYNETFAPVMNSKSWHFMLAMAAELNYTVATIDVANAFLNGYLKEEIYMEMPRGFEKEDYICKMKKSLYGLKQAANVWFEELVKILIDKMSYKQLQSDNVMFVKDIQGGKIMLGGHVDDLLIVAPTDNDQEMFKREFERHLKIKQGDLDVYLGVQAHRDPKTGTITLHHFRKIHELLKSRGLLQCKPVSTPIQPNVQPLSRHDCTPEGTTLPIDMHKQFRSDVGLLMHIMHMSRPDIAVAVKRLTEGLDRPGEKHFQHRDWLLRYLAGTKGYGIIYYGKNDPIRKQPNIRFDLHGYYDADWGSDTFDRRSRFGYVFLMAGGAISWWSGKEDLVASSTVHAEYIGQDAAARELEWLIQLQREIGFTAASSPRIYGYGLGNTPWLYGDNQGAQSLAKNPVNHKQSKHIDIKYHRIRELLKNGVFRLEYVPTKENVADIFTKGLDKPSFEKHRAAMGMHKIRED
jgi:hypothetical protein